MGSWDGMETFWERHEGTNSRACLLSFFFIFKVHNLGSGPCLRFLVKVQILDFWEQWCWFYCCFALDICVRLSGWEIFRETQRYYHCVHVNCCYI